MNNDYTNNNDFNESYTNNQQGSYFDDNYSNDNDSKDNLDDSLYNDGEDKRPKLVIIIVGIVVLVILILIFMFACSKINKKSNNNNLSNISVTNGELTPSFNKGNLEYAVAASEDIVSISCSSESSKATTEGCNKRIYLTDTCIEHKIIVRAQDKSVKEYKLNICKQDKNAPIIKNVVLSPNGYSKNEVKVTVDVESVSPLHDEAYSMDGGITWQKENVFTLTENKKIEIKVRNVNNTESAVVEKEINTIDKTNPTVKVSGSINSGSSTYSNVELNAEVDPQSTLSGYKYQWYRGNSKIKGATQSTYLATSSGTYKVVVTTGAGNSATSNKYVVNKKSSGGSSGNNGNNSNNYSIKINAVKGNPSNWTSQDVTLSINAQASKGLHSSAYSFDGGKTYQKSNSKKFSKNQTVNIVVRDKNGNKTTWKVEINKIDKTTPNVSISGSHYIGNTLTASVNPNSSASGYKYQWYENGTAISGATSKTYKTNKVGTYKVIVTTGAGKSGSASVSVSNKVTASVSIKSSVTSGKWTNQNVKLTASITNGSASRYEWYKNNSKYSACTTNTCTISSAQEATYKVRAITTSGDTTAFSGVISVKVDKTKPQLELKLTLGSYDGSKYTPGSVASKAVYVSAVARDNMKMDNMLFQYLASDSKNNQWYSHPTKAWSSSTISGKSAYSKVYFNDNTTYPFVVRATDAAGNYTDVKATIIINKNQSTPTPEVNLKAPTIALSHSSNFNVPYTGNITFTLKNTNSVGTLQYKLGNGSWTNYSGKATTLLSSTGSQTVHARVSYNGKTSSEAKSTGYCNKDIPTQDRNNNGVDSGNKCWFQLTMKHNGSSLPSGVTKNRYYYAYWKATPTNDTSNKYWNTSGYESKLRKECGYYPPQGVKIFDSKSSNVTTKLYQKSSKQYYCFAIKEYRANDITSVNRWKVWYKMSNTGATCSASAYTSQKYDG